MSVEVIESPEANILACNIKHDVIYEVVKGYYSEVTLATKSLIVRIGDAVYRINDLPTIVFCGNISSRFLTLVEVKKLRKGTKLNFVLEG